MFNPKHFQGDSYELTLLINFLVFALSGALNSLILYLAIRPKDERRNRPQKSMASPL
jgi:hypothetical protein